jgi:hypothetical protein
MTIQEFGTIMQSEAAVKIVLLNNKYLGMVRQWQQLFFDKRYSHTYMVNPDFIQVANGFGIEGKKVVDRPDLEGAVEEMLNHNGAYLLEVSIEKEDNVFPMVPTGASVAEVIWRQLISNILKRRKMTDTYTITAFSENHIGLLNRITIIFTRRNVNIHSLPFLNLQYGVFQNSPLLLLKPKKKLERWLAR